MALRTFVFDAYGTLFDVHSVVALGERLFPGQGAQLSQTWRSKQLEYTWLRSLMARYCSFEQVTADALRVACASLGLELTAAHERALMAAYDRLDTFPEVMPALGALASRPLAILSNGSRRMLDAVVANAGLDRVLAHVLSVDDVGIFKPSPSVYRMVPERLGVAAADVGFVSSNYWDVCGAAAFGFRAFWINRAGARPDRLGLEPAAELARLTDLAAHAV